MKITAALTREQGQTFVVVLVKDRVLTSPTQRQEMTGWAEATFGVRAALLAENSGKTWGDRDIVRWLANVHPSQLPWREYNYSERAA